MAILSIPWPTAELRLHLKTVVPHAAMAAEVTNTTEPELTS